VIGVGHTSRLKMANGSLPLRWLVCPLWSPLMIFLVSLDLSHQYFFYDTNNVIIKVLICLRDLFFFSPVSLTNYNEDKRERERDEKDLEGAPKHQWWHHQYCRKDLKDMNPKTLKNIINDNWGGPHEPPKSKWVTCHIWMARVTYPCHHW